MEVSVDGEVNLSYMVASGPGLYKWPAEPDIDWQPLTSIKKKACAASSDQLS